MAGQIIATTVRVLYRYLPDCIVDTIVEYMDVVLFSELLHQIRKIHNNPSLENEQSKIKEVVKLMLKEFDPFVGSSWLRIQGCYFIFQYLAQVQSKMPPSETFWLKHWWQAEIKLREFYMDMEKYKQYNCGLADLRRWVPIAYEFFFDLHIDQVIKKPFANEQEFSQQALIGFNSKKEIPYQLLTIKFPPLPTTRYP